MFSKFLWGFPLGVSGFLTRSEDIQVRLIVDPLFPRGLSSKLKKNYLKTAKKIVFYKENVLVCIGPQLQQHLRDSLHLLPIGLASF